MEELRREFEALQQRWEADHRQLVRQESMSDLLHALVLLLDRLPSVESTAVSDKDRMLKEQFLEKVRSVNLLWDLKRKVDQDPETTKSVCSG